MAADHGARRAAVQIPSRTQSPKIARIRHVCVCVCLCVCVSVSVCVCVCVLQKSYIQDEVWHMVLVIIFVSSTCDGFLWSGNSFPSSGFGMLKFCVCVNSKMGLSFISNRRRRKEGTFCAAELAGIEPTPAHSRRAVYVRLNLSATADIVSIPHSATLVLLNSDCVFLFRVQF